MHSWPLTHRLTNKDPDTHTEGLGFGATVIPNLCKWCARGAGIILEYVYEWW